MESQQSESESFSVISDYLQPRGLYSPWNSPGQITGVGSHSLLQGIFPTQGSNPSLLHCRQILYQLSHQRSPRILEWEAYPFSRGSSWPRDWTWVSCIAGRFFTIWATGEALMCRYSVQRSFGRSLFQILLPVLIWTGGLLNLLPSCHLDIFLQFHPPCVFFFFPPAFLMLKAIFPGTHIGISLSLFLHFWYAFLGYHTHSAS